MSDTTSTTSKFALSNKAYDYTKFVAQILLPALGTLYFAVAVIWGIDGADKVVGTITAVDVFLGVVLGLSSNNYKKAKDAGDVDTDGDFVIDTVDPMKDTYTLDVATPLNEVANKNTITLKVKSNTTPSE